MAKKISTKSKDKKPSTPKEKKVVDVLNELTKKLKPSNIRFVYLYLGGEDGKCFNNATLAYLRAYEIETRTTKDADGNYTSEYKSAKTNGSRLLTNADIQKYKDAVLLHAGFNPDTVKRRFAELAYQNKNLPIALTATDRIAKITGVLKEDSKSVDIPQLTELTEHIKAILTP